MQFTRHDFLNAAALTSTATASGSVLCSNGDQLGLYLQWTPAAAGRVLTITIEVSPDLDSVADASADWHQFGEYDYSDADTKAQTLFDIQKTAAGTDEEFLAPFIFACPAGRVRIKYSQSGASGGTLTAKLLSRAS